jgi:hypothetical protein
MTNHPSPENDRLSRLTEGQLKGELSAGEKADLSELLDGSEEAQRRFVELTEFETALAEAHQEPSPAFSIENHERSRLPALTVKMLPWLVAAACVMFMFWPRANDVEPAPGEAVSPKPLAMLVDQVDATFASPRATGDVRFDRGVYELEQGAIHLRFANGADLVIEGPARFELIDPLHARLEYGNIRAIVPPTAKGFTVATKNANFEDVGTEFGLRVERETGEESLLVFDGQVNVRRPDSNILLSSIQGGETHQYKNGKPTEPADIQPEMFPEPGGIGFRRWLADKAFRLHDPSLLALFSFERETNQPTVLRNLQTDGVSAVSDARIHGAHWGSGRWQGKGALLFDSPNDFAELDVEGEFNELTIATWVMVNRLDHPLNAVFDSNGWESGDVHLQIQRQGAPYADLYEARGGERQHWDTVVPMAKWTHLVATYSVADRKMRVFVNGERSYECSLNNEGHIQPGTCRIGNWLAVGEFAPVRSFNGRIDELAIWNRALSEAEISAEMRRGQPSFLWRDK